MINKGVVESVKHSTDNIKTGLDLKVSEFLDKFPVPIKYMNIIPIFDKNKNGPSIKSPGYNWKKYQKTRYPLKSLLRKKNSNYGLICGDPLSQGIYLVVVDLDNKLFMEQFKGEDTLIVKTPNEGYHIYYYTTEAVDKKTRFLKLPIDIQGVGSYVMIPPSQYENGSYEIIKDQSIKTVDHLLNYVTDKLPTSLKSIEKLENKQPSGIKQFKKQLHEKISLLDIVKDHYPTWYEPREEYEHGNVIRLFNPLKKQESSNPSFVIFEETQTWYSHSTDESGDVIDFIKLIKKESSLDHALQYLQKEYGIKAPILKPKKEDNKGTFIESFDEFLSKIEGNSNTITHGMDYDNKIGLVYVSVYPEGGNGIYGISRYKPIKAISKPDVINKELPDDVYICEGYKFKLNNRTRKGISDLLFELHTKDGFEYKTISRLFELLLESTQQDYLELQEKNEYYFLVLWIFGTYLRPLFVWYPYVTFYGLRDVGKSTALTLLSNLCFNGSGYISGNASEASLFRKASSTKGFFTIDHYEEVRKSKEKRQIITQYLESAWYLNSTIDKVNKETLELEQFKVASSVAIGTREIDDVLEEKGIIIQMVETDDKTKRKNSSKMHKDPFFGEIQKECMATSLIYQDQIIKAYDSIGDIDGLEGRDYNKFLPILAIAQVIDKENNSRYNLNEEMVSFAVKYRLNRKKDLKDTEELLLKLILEYKIELTTYSELAEKMNDNSTESYTWQKAKSDLTKLYIIQRKHENKHPVKIEIDLNRAEKRAKSRGITLKEKEPPIKDLVTLKIEDDTNKLEPSPQVNYEDIPILTKDSIKTNEITESYNILTENNPIELNSFIDKLVTRTSNSLLRSWGLFEYFKKEKYVNFKSEGWIQATNKFEEILS